MNLYNRNFQYSSIIEKKDHSFGKARSIISAPLKRLNYQLGAILGLTVMRLTHFDLELVNECWSPRSLFIELIGDLDCLFSAFLEIKKRRAGSGSSGLMWALISRPKRRLIYQWHKLGEPRSHRWSCFRFPIAGLYHTMQTLFPRGV